MGIRIVNAPLEDLLFGFSLVVLTMAVWLKLDGLGEKRGIKQNAKQMENS